MGDNARYLFRASRDAHKSITRLFDFMHPTAISLWNLRWQVQGYLASVPDADSKTLEGRFASGSGIGAGSLKRATVEATWEEQLENFASLILVNTIAIFEDFASAVSVLSNLTENQKRAVEKKLQFPSSAPNGGLNAATTLLGHSGVTTGAVTWDKKTQRRIDESSIEQLLVCYRYFKELRNAISHNGGKATQQLLAAQSAYLQAISNGKIGPALAPNVHIVSSMRDELKVTYRGVIGFSEVILHIIATYDSILSRTSIVENELRAVLEVDKKMWPTTEKGKVRRFKKIFDPNKFPQFSITSDLVSFLKTEGIIPSMVNI